MYQAHFGFQRQPFTAGDAVRSFFESASSREAVPPLRHALRSDPGVAVLTGPVGCGKSSLLRHLQQQLALDGRACLCSAASLETPADLLEFLDSASQSSSEREKEPQKSERAAMRASRWAVREKLRRSSQFWGPVLLLLDDAHLLPTAVLHELKSLIDEGTDFGPLLRTLIAGPLSLEETLARPSHAEFGHRIRCHVFLEPLSIQESTQYLQHQIEFAGGRPTELIAPDAVDMITRAAEGLPRNLNLLADESLLEAATRNVTLVDADCVRAAFRRLVHLPCEWNSAAVEDASCDEPTVDEPSAEDCSASAHVQAAGTVVEFGADDTSDESDLESSASPESETYSPSATAFEVGAPAPAKTTSEEPSSSDTALLADAAVSDDTALLSDDDSKDTGTFEFSAADDVASMSEDEDQQLDLAPFEEPDVEEPAFSVGYTFDGGDVGDALDLDSAEQLTGAVEAPVEEVLNTDTAADERDTVSVPDEPADCQADFESEESPSADNIPTCEGVFEPVFDRFTWIEFQRDVPPGQMPLDALPAPCDSIDDPELPEPVADVPLLESITITDTSDEAIQELLGSNFASDVDDNDSEAAASELESDWVDGQLLNAEFDSTAESDASGLLDNKNAVPADASEDAAEDDDEEAAILMDLSRVAETVKDAVSQPADDTAAESELYRRQEESEQEAVAPTDDQSGESDVWYRRKADDGQQRDVSAESLSVSTDGSETDADEMASTEQENSEADHGLRLMDGQIDGERVEDAARRLLGLDQLQLTRPPRETDADPESPTAQEESDRKTYVESAHGGEPDVPVDPEAADSNRDQVPRFDMLFSNLRRRRNERRRGSRLDF